MTTFKLRRFPKGNVLLTALVFSVIAGTLGVYLLRNTSQQARLAKRSGNESIVLMTAHAAATLLKAELFNNYTDSFEPSTAWPECKKVGMEGPTQFLRILSNPADATYVTNTTVCPTKTLALSRFKVGSASTLTLQAFRTAVFVPNDKINGFDVQMKVTDFNLDAQRTQILGDVSLSITKPLPVQKTLRFAIDLKRTLNPTRQIAGCTICRTTPGAVCCGGTYRFTYLNSSGELIDASYDLETQMLTQTSNTQYNTIASVDRINPRFVTVKIGQGRGPALDARVDYDAGDYCLNNVDAANPLLWVVDGVRGTDLGTGLEDDFYLTTHGNIIQNIANPFDNMNTNSGTVAHANGVVLDPKIISIAYSDDTFSLLRSDGAILRTRTLTDPDAWTEVNGLRVPTAVRLAMGESTKCP